MHCSVVSGMHLDKGCDLIVDTGDSVYYNHALIYFNLTKGLFSYVKMAFFIHNFFQYILKFIKIVSSCNLL